MNIELSHRVDCLCDFTYDFYWQHRGSRLTPSAVIPHQIATSHTYQDLVFALKKGEDVNIKGNAGKRLGSSLGVDLKFFGGPGCSIPVGSIVVDGDIDSRAGISMVSGAIYVKSISRQPLGNVIEVESDRKAYRKFVSITDILNSETNEKILHPNAIEDGCLYLRDDILRDTIAARLDANKKVFVEGDAGMSTGILMKRGFIQVSGNSGMNTAVLLRGGTIIIDNTGEFAGVDMKGGSLIIHGKAKGYVGANMKGGTIFYKGDAMVPGHRVNEKEIGMLVRLLDISQVEAMMFKRYPSQDIP